MHVAKAGCRSPATVKGLAQRIDGAWTRLATIVRHDGQISLSTMVGGGRDERVVAAAGSF